jgi:hypothetical protein
MYSRIQCMHMHGFLLINYSMCAFLEFYKLQCCTNKVFCEIYCIGLLNGIPAKFNVYFCEVSSNLHEILEN